MQNNLMIRLIAIAWGATAILMLVLFLTSRPVQPVEQDTPPAVYVLDPVAYPKAEQANRDGVIEYAYEVPYLLDGRPYSIFARSERDRDGVLEYLEGLE